MSSYLNIYGVLKDSEKKISLASFSRSHQLYQELNDNLSIPWAGNDDVYMDLTNTDIQRVISNVNKQISEVDKRLSEYERHANGNIDIINDILSFKEYREELISTREYLYFLEELIDNTTYNYEDAFEKIICNIS
ncbi:MAG: hypothetical protein ACI4OP_02870 [Candidatus Coprovivens sp.]